MYFARLSLQTGVMYGFQMICGMTVAIITARWLGPEGVGIFAVVVLCKSMSFYFCNLGLGTALGYQVAKQEIPVRFALKIALLAGGVLSVLAVLCLIASWRWRCSPWHGIAPTVFLPMLLAIPLFFCNSYMSRILSGQLRIPAVNAAQGLCAVANTALVCLFVVGLGLGVSGAVCAFVVADAITCLYLLLQFHGVADRGVEGFANTSFTAQILSLFRYGKWNYLTVLATSWAEDLPLMFLRFLAPTSAAVGWYSRAYGLGMKVRMFALPVSNVLFPVTAASDAGRAVWRTNVLCRNALLLTGLLMIPLVLLARPLVSLLFGAEFLPSVAVLRAMAPGVLMWPLGRFVGVHLAASGNARIQALLSMAPVCVGLVTCWILVGRGEATWAGGSLSVILIVNTSCRLWAYRMCTRTSLVQVLVPQRGDWEYWQRGLGWLASRSVTLLRRRKTQEGSLP